MLQEDYISEIEFNRFRLTSTKNFQRDIQRTAAAILRTRDEWLRIAPEFADFHGLVDEMVVQEMRRVGEEERDTVLNLLRKCRGNGEMAMGLYAVWASCAFHVHDAIVRKNRMPLPVEITAWTLEYGQQLTLVYRRTQDALPRRGKHRGGHVARIPPRKRKNRK